MAWARARRPAPVGPGRPVPGRRDGPGRDGESLSLAAHRRREGERPAGLAPPQAGRHRHPGGGLCLRVHRPGAFARFFGHAVQPAGAAGCQGPLHGCACAVAARTGVSRWPGRGADACLCVAIQRPVADAEHPHRRAAGPGRSHGQQRQHRRGGQGHGFGAHPEPVAAVGLAEGGARPPGLWRGPRSRSDRSHPHRRVPAARLGRSAEGGSGGQSPLSQPRHRAGLCRHRGRGPGPAGPGQPGRALCRSALCLAQRAGRGPKPAEPGRLGGLEPQHRARRPCPAVVGRRSLLDAGRRLCAGRRARPPHPATAEAAAGNARPRHRPEAAAASARAFARRRVARVPCHRCRRAGPGPAARLRPAGHAQQGRHLPREGAAQL